MAHHPPEWHYGPRKRIKPRYPKSWKCSEGHGPNPYYWLNCPQCGQERPEKE